MEIEKLKELIEAVSASELTEFDFEEGNVKLHLGRNNPEVKTVVMNPDLMSAGGTGIAAGTVQIQAPDAADSSAQTGGTTVDSPLVGTFYAAPAEDAAPFVSVGDVVKKGQILAIVEAMKLMNEIESTADGTVTEILVENGQTVEYGQPLFRIG